MLQILSVTFPFFALVLAGYVAARRAWLPQASIAGLNAFVLFFALPCMLYRFGRATPVAQLLDGAALGVYLCCAVLMVAVAVALARWQRLDWNNAAFGALVAAFPNTGFMGMPLLIVLFGPRAAAPVMLTIAIDLVLTTSLCIALSRLDLGGGSARQAARHALKAVASNPMPWAIISGAVASWGQWDLPAPLMKTVGLLADSASPVALFTIGAVLARSQSMPGARSAPSVRWMDYMPVALLKLFLHPLLVLLVGRAAIAMGLPLDGFALMVIVLVAALPSASNVSLLAERFGANNGRIARIILASTMLAFFSFAWAVKLMAN